MPAAETTKIEIEIAIEDEIALRHLSETGGGSIADLAAAAVVEGIEELARTHRENAADLASVLNDAKTVVINDRNLTLQRCWKGRELGWMDLQHQTPQSIEEMREHLNTKADFDIGEFDTAIWALYGRPPKPARMTTEAVVRRCQYLREAGYKVKPLPETGITP